MLVYLWFCVLTMAVFPGNERLVQTHVSAFQSRLLAAADAPKPEAKPGVAIGAASLFR